MSIFIKGMEMPTRCFDCPMCEISDIEICCSISIGVAVSYEEIDEQIAIQERPSWCPLVPVPPHGRLVDLDTLQKQIDIARNCGTIGKTAHYKLQKLIKDAPTIIDAEAGDE